MRDTDFLAELRARKARVAEPPTTASESPPAANVAAAAPSVVDAPPAPEPVTIDSDARPLPVPGTDGADVARSTATPDASRTAPLLLPDSRIRAAGGWNAFGEDLTATFAELERRLFVAPDGASESARVACEQIASAALDKLDLHFIPVCEVWAAATEDSLADEDSVVADALLHGALEPAFEQARGIVGTVRAIHDRVLAYDPDLAGPWLKLSNELHDRLASRVEIVEAVGTPGSPQNLRARAGGHARAALEAMSPEERRRAARESAIRRMSPSDAAAARAADTAAERTAREKAALDVALKEWSTAAGALVDRYPLVKAIVDKGHGPVSELLQVAGLGAKSVTTRTNRDGSTTRLVSERLPTLTAIVDTPHGVEFEFEPLRGQSVATWEKALGVLGLELGMTTLTVAQRGRLIVVSTNDAALPELPGTLARSRPAPYDAALGRSFLGTSESGADAWITWAGNSGMVNGGVPGSGKTASMLPVLAGMHGHAELHIFDGKAGFDLEPLRPIARTFDNSGDIDGPLLDTLDRVEQLRVARSRAIYERTGIANFWSVPVAQRVALDVYPVVVVIDECQTWLDTSGMDTNERAQAAAITKGVRQLIQKGRAAGIIVVLTTQKPDAKSIPTVIRDNSGLRIAFRVTTREQGNTVLGVLADGTPRPTDIPRSAKGRCIMAAEDGGVDVVQTMYVTPSDIATALAGAKPVPDQLSVATLLSKN